MPSISSQKTQKHGISRREFLWLTSMSAAGMLAGCAADPITGRKQLMLVSEETEIRIDKKQSPHQFSSDYGTLQDKTLNNYIDATGKRIAALTHRPHMPYSFRGVNATYVNAYAFPGGSIAATRGILLALDNEAELAALLGHELGHVNARHTAEQMSKGVLTNALVGGISAVAGTRSAALGKLASRLGMVGAGALLAAYSRDNEREADALGLEYMTSTGYNAQGFVGLMDILRSLSKRKPSAIELMFATHPMSDERYQTAVNAVQTQSRTTKKLPWHRDRYMDHTAGLRAIKGAIDALQKGESAMAKGKYNDAQKHFKKALKQVPDDYAGLLMMSKCLLAQKKDAEAKRFAEKAKAIYPREAQARHLLGFANLRTKNFDAAYQEFADYDKLLPGNPNTTFFKGFSLEGMQRIEPAANEYYQYLQAVNRGKQAQHAYKRLVEWGYIKP
ncbi:MAG: M48 family metalloprotease [Candidatus Desulfatibia sp.]|uniref:M48 family metalloprotease n=1 Tax=Candidatus Desulfatibia sp. TaxID=3101189 RepID=UPI002F2C8EBC